MVSILSYLMHIHVRDHILESQPALDCMSILAAHVEMRMLVSHIPFAPIRQAVDNVASYFYYYHLAS